MKCEEINDNLAIETVARWTPDKGKTMVSCPCTIAKNNIVGSRPTLDDDGIMSREHSNIMLKSGGELTVDIPYETSKTFVI